VSVYLLICGINYHSIAYYKLFIVQLHTSYSVCTIVSVGGSKALTVVYIMNPRNQAMTAVYENLIRF